VDYSLFIMMMMVEMTDSLEVDYSPFIMVMMVEMLDKAEIRQCFPL
jgi:hypothetical protein